MPIFQQYNPGKPLKIGQVWELKSHSPFEYFQIGFLLLVLAMGYEYMFVFVCLFSEWSKSYSVTDLWLWHWKNFTQFYVSHVGNHETLLEELCKVLSLTQKLHYSYHLQPSGLAKKTNGILKWKLSKLSEIFELSLLTVSLLMS